MLQSNVQNETMTSNAQIPVINDHEKRNGKCYIVAMFYFKSKS